MQTASSAAVRKGIQPTIAVLANGKTRAEVKAGETVTLSAVIEVPPNAGRVVAVEWSPEGSAEFSLAELRAAATKGLRVSLKTTHTFTEPGIYFPVLRAASQRQADASTPYARIQNLGRVRVVVQ